MLPAATMAQAAAQTAAPKPPMAGHAFPHDELAAKQSGTILMRQILNGDTHTGYLLDLHESELPAGEAPHPPHRHVHEEMLLIREGLLEITIEGKSTRLGPGSVAYLASNREHGWRNAGKTTATYFVLALGDDKA